jgi:GNAT superfamily N-acetyltransferase
MGAVVLRAPAPGDLGWIVARHGSLYASEYGWGAPFEALVADVIAEYAREHAEAPAQTAAWIADLGGRPAGSVLCMRDDAATARLRLLLVEPFARGHGIGRLLVDECIRFARGADYRRLVLWTNEPLVHARPIYERAGFELVGERPHTRFGPEVVGQDWALDLQPGGLSRR